MAPFRPLHRRSLEEVEAENAVLRAENRQLHRDRRFVLLVVKAMRRDLDEVTAAGRRNDVIAALLFIPVIAWLVISVLARCV